MGTQEMSVPANVTVILQARMSSVRFPGKSMRRIGELSLTELCARRAANTGIPVVVATSTDPSDDILWDCIRRSGLPVHRGPLNNVLERFSDIISTMTPSDRVIRMTADNPVPDGDLLAKLIDFHQNQNAKYSMIKWPESGLPYGISAEIFDVKVFKDLYHLSIENHSSQEHVTSTIREHFPPSLLRIADLAMQEGLQGKNLINLRCSVDDESDFKLVSQIFAKTDIVNEPWQELILKLSRIAYEKP